MFDPTRTLGQVIARQSRGSDFELLGGICLWVADGMSEHTAWRIESKHEAMPLIEISARVLSTLLAVSTRPGGHSEPKERSEIDIQRCS